MRELDSNNELWAWPRVQTNANAILIAAENASKSPYKTSVHEESSIKLTKKNASICRSPEKSRVFSGHVRKAGSHVTL